VLVKTALGFLLLLSLEACDQSAAPPMPRNLFAEAARLCGLHNTTFTPTRGLFLRGSLIDFRGEADPVAAHECFNSKLDEAEHVFWVNGKPPEHIGYSWDWQI
jgi:hypothetical protein